MCHASILAERAAALCRDCSHSVSRHVRIAREVQPQVTLSAVDQISVGHGQNVLMLLQQQWAAFPRLPLAHPCPWDIALRALFISLRQHTRSPQIPRINCMSRTHLPLKDVTFLMASTLGFRVHYSTRRVLFLSRHRQQGHRSANA